MNTFQSWSPMYRYENNRIAEYQRVAAATQWHRFRKFSREAVCIVPRRVNTVSRVQNRRFTRTCRRDSAYCSLGRIPLDANKSHAIDSLASESERNRAFVKSVLNWKRNLSNTFVPAIATANCFRVLLCLFQPRIPSRTEGPCQPSVSSVKEI